MKSNRRFARIKQSNHSKWGESSQISAKWQISGLIVHHVEFRKGLHVSRAAECSQLLELFVAENVGCDRLVVVGWLVGWLWLVGSVVGWVAVVGWLWLVGWLVGWLWLVGSVVGWVAVVGWLWLVGWLVGWLWSRARQHFGNCVTPICLQIAANAANLAGSAIAVKRAGVQANVCVVYFEGTLVQAVKREAKRKSII